MAPRHFQWGHLVSPLSVRTSIRPVRPVRNTNGFRSIYFEKISVLDSNFIHGYIIIKCRPSSIEGKIHQLLWELWPFFTFEKMVSIRYLFKTLVY